MQNKTFDMDLDFHATATLLGACQRKSVSLIGRSSLRNSARAASRTSGMPTGEPARAARNAAFKAILWIFPPVIFRRARRSKSSASFGKPGGKKIGRAHV